MQNKEKKWHLVYEDFSSLLEFGLIEIVGTKFGLPMYDLTELGKQVLNEYENK